jgi:hypothetical protein
VRDERIYILSLSPSSPSYDKVLHYIFIFIIDPSIFIMTLDESPTNASTSHIENNESDNRGGSSQVIVSNDNFAIQEEKRESYGTLPEGRVHPLPSAAHALKELVVQLLVARRNQLQRYYPG